jgi:hypothetical protein
MRAWIVGVLVTTGVSAGLGLGCGGRGGSAPPDDQAPGPDAGAATTPDPTFSSPSVCESGQSWSGSGDDEHEHEHEHERTKGKYDDDGSPDMLPGRACIACHAQNEGPTFSIAGTVFPSGHVPDDCLPTVAAAEDLAQATVVITDDNDHTLALALTPTGNFAQWDDGYGAVAFPVTAKVVYQGKERAMRTPQSSGDCNGCHTDTGERGAPGRITLP